MKFFRKSRRRSRPATITVLQENKGLAYSIKAIRDGKGRTVKLILKIMNAAIYEGYIILAIHANGKFNKTVRYIASDDGRKEFSNLIESIQKCNDADELIISLSSYGFGPVLRKHRINEIMEHYKLLL